MYPLTKCLPHTHTNFENQTQLLNNFHLILYLPLCVCHTFICVSHKCQLLVTQFMVGLIIFPFLMHTLLNIEGQFTFHLWWPHHTYYGRTSNIPAPAATSTRTRKDNLDKICLFSLLDNGQI